MNSVTAMTIEPDQQVPLLDQLTGPARELLARAEDVAGDVVVNAGGPVPVAELAELLDLGLVTRAPSGAYPLTARGVAVRLFVPTPRQERITVDITPRSMELFLAYARDAGNWSGTPLVGGNVGGSAEDRGNLTQLKRAGLISTFPYDGDTWIEFTESGRALAADNGITL